MSRPLRIEIPGGLYHVMSRGNERRRIVRDDADRSKRVEWLRRTVETYGWFFHAFVVMTNHDHMFVQTPDPNLSAGLIDVIVVLAISFRGVSRLTSLRQRGTISN